MHATENTILIVLEILVRDGIKVGPSMTFGLSYERVCAWESTRSHAAV